MAEDDRFYVKTLRMQNFRCFEDVELGPFDPHFNLLVGENGAGKSSVLVALANLFRQFGKPELDGPGEKLVGRDDVRLEHRTGVEGVTSIKLHLPGAISARAFAGTDELAAYETISDTEASGANTDREVVKPLLGIVPFRPGMNSQGQIVDAPLRLITFYRTSRAFGSNRLFIKSSSGNTLDRIKALENWNNAGTNPAALREWVKDQTAVRLQQIQRAAATATPRPFNQIGAIYTAVREAVEDVTSFDFDFDRQDIVVQLESGSRSDFSGMSDGQRMFIGLVADIARRACQLNAAFLGSKSLEETPGLVLIDEIDLHLHPKWQRQIVPALKKVFPKVQFFATTHSPQVIGECKPEELVLLTPEGQKRPGPSGSYGRDSNWVLECVMGAEGRDREVAEQLKAIWDAIEKGAFRKARTQIKKLRAKIGDDSDIIGAESYMWRIEHAGDEAAE